MSGFVEVALFIVEQGTFDPKAFFKKKKLDCYFSLQGSRVIVALKGYQYPVGMLEDLSQVCAQLIHVIYGEDHGWSLEWYQNGSFKEEVNVDYEKEGVPEGDIAKLTKGLESVGAPAATVQSLNELLGSGTMEQTEAQSWQLLQQALEIELDDHFSYDFLESQSQSYKKSIGIQELKIQKTLPIKKIILKELAPAMSKKGYEYTLDSEMPYDYVFFRKIQGIEVGLEFDIQKQDSEYLIIPQFKTLFHNVIFENYKSLKFDSKEKLTQVLEQIKEQFTDYENKLQQDLVYEKFDNHLVYLTLVTRSWRDMDCKKTSKDP